MNVLNIGSGPNLEDGSINLDIYPHPGVDVVADITKHWPFDDNFFDEIHAYHVLEHVQDLVFVLNEAFRVLLPGGLFRIRVPWFNGEWAHGDPTHVRFFDHNSFSIFSDWYYRYTYLGIYAPWKKVSQTYTRSFPSAFKNQLRALGFSPIKEMSVVLQKP